MGKLNPSSRETGYLKPGQFYGKVSKNYQLSGFTLSELHHETPKRLHRHAHELAYFCLLLEGNYREFFGTKEIVYTPLTIGYHPPDTVHRDEIGNHGGHFFAIEVADQWLERLREYTSIPSSICELHGGELVWLALRLYRECTDFDLYSPLAVEGLILEMLATVARAQPEKTRRPPTWLLQTVDLLHAEFHQNLTITDIAGRVGVHPFHLSKTFRHTFHQPIGDYLQRLRIHFATQQLSQAETKLSDIALAAGFSDQSHFTRVFKTITGTTPKEFRSTLRLGQQLGSGNTENEKNLW
ncbi:MAG TPA: AraC family transcriptional regulator [Acidobacteriota bacterium]|nr:AraC family transcriptional regulator [Acidobacteriota bacterium]HNC44489.1 AraC family transcriptional regulator [Acidobacteriota bacterium]HNG95112.1 AraC family transcriptional regulator [Acidobacteriota bacterium]